MIFHSKRALISLVVFGILQGCVSAPSLFEVQEFCEGKVKKYTSRDKSQSILVECKDE